MLICHCQGVSEREVESAIVSGACTHPAIARACGAGSMCGGCLPLIEELLDAYAPTSAAPHLAQTLGLVG
jgi:bacterioferritin-associated ferredoxin